MNVSIGRPTVLSAYLLALGAFFSLVYCYHEWRRSHSKKASRLVLNQLLDPPKPVGDNFDYEKSLPQQHRPFYPARKGSLRMGLKAISRNEWLMIDWDVKQTLRNRIMYLNFWSDGRLLVENSFATEACQELWETVTEFMVNKYPQYFQLKNERFENKIMGYSSAKRGADMSNVEILKELSLNFEEDFILLSYDDKLDEYVVRGCNHLHPTGFNPRDILDKPLSALHAPVPHYEENLRRPMARFFSKLKVGNCVQRLNWSCQMGTNLCLPDKDSAEIECIKQRDDSQVSRTSSNELDPNQMYVRVERQTLSRLPKSKFVIFTVRTYLYSLKMLKEEGYGEALGESIDNLDYQFGHYKGRPVWGDIVQEYMRK